MDIIFYYLQLHCSVENIEKKFAFTILYVFTLCVFCIV